MTPGSDLLGDAFELIGTITIQWKKYNGRVCDAAGVYISSYDDPVDIEASVQAADRNVYKNLGLDFQRNVLVVYAENDVVDIDRGQSGDQFIIGGKLYQTVSNNPWFSLDGWSSFTIIEIKPSNKV